MQKKSCFIKFLSIIVSVILSVSFFSNLSLSVLADEDNTDNSSPVTFESDKVFYSKILKEYLDKGYSDYSGQKIVLDILNCYSSLYSFENSFAFEDSIINGLVWDKQQDNVSFNFNIEQEGLYNIGIEYIPIFGGSSDISRAIIIDGKTIFSEMENIEFNRFYRDTSEPKVDNKGDEIKPFSEEFIKLEDRLITDSEGRYSEPLKFYFDIGAHTITFKYIREPMFIKSVYLSAPNVTENYDYSIDISNVGSTFSFEAEDYKYVYEKSDSVIGPETSGDPSASPRSLYNIKMNYIGGSNYSKGNQYITWKFDVNKSGYYAIGLRLAQWYNDGLPVYRQILIDGKVPFSEFSCYQFDYNSLWYSKVLSDSENIPYYVWLEKGKHTFSLIAKTGDFAVIEQNLFDATSELSKLIRKIKMITGEEPDNNYDYEIEKTVPGIKNYLQSICDKVETCEKSALKLANKKSSMSNSFSSIVVQLNQMIDDTDRITKRLSDLETALGNLGDWINTIKNVPLGIDKITFLSPNDSYENYNASIWQKLYTSIVKFTTSFTKDYQNVSAEVSDVKVKKTINVWAGRGTEWCRLIKQLADANFTPKTGIAIKMNTLPTSQLSAAGVNSLMLSVAAGTAPDVVLGLGSSMPLEYSIRNAIVDLSKFSDFYEVKSSLFDEAFKPLSYRGKVFAVPDTISFRCVFYRTDIFNELKLTPPDTWDEFYNTTLPVLYQNGMKCYIPMLYDIFLFQNNGTYYSEDGHSSALNTKQAYSAFKSTCELYTNYCIPVSANYFTRFRTGEMPMIIGTSADYLTFASAAPEIADSWTIAPIPATLTEDGKNRSSSGITVDCNVIMSQSELQNESWEFLKWWMSDETQIEFSKQIENQMGLTARYFSANKNAFNTLSFSKSEFNVINEFFENNIESKAVLGGYYTSRHILNAWTRCVESGENFRDSIEKAVEDIDIELRRKQMQYGEYDN